MGQRLQLHDILKNVLGTAHVYFQPPASVQMQYPCIVYKRDNADTEFADDKPYAITKRYMVTLITENPDDDIWQGIASLPTCRHNRWYAVNNLNHDVFNLYF